MEPQNLFHTPPRSRVSSFQGDLACLPTSPEPGMWAGATTTLPTNQGSSGLPLLPGVTLD